LENRDLDGKMGSKLVRKIVWEGVEWIHLAQDRDQWPAVVNAVMNLRVLAPLSRCALPVDCRKKLHLSQTTFLYLYYEF
jgi:hypothetical protein